MEIKKRIINETSRLLTIKSCKSITMDEIANNLGISKRTLYEQFTDKRTLLEECLIKHFETAILESDRIVETSENALISIMLMMKKANSSINSIRYDYIKDLNKYYPDIYLRTFQNHIIFQKQLGNNLLQRALNEDLVMRDINFDLLHSMLQLNLFYCSQNEYMMQNPKHSATEIALIHMFIIIRGIATIKGVKIIDKYKEVFFK